MNPRKELQDFWFHLRRLALAKIPAISGLAALFVAGWVSSTFTTSPVRAFAVRAGWTHGSRHYVHGTTYRIMSIGLPILAAAVTAYLVQRHLRRRRERDLIQDRLIVARRPHLQEEAKRRETILDDALNLGLLTPAEHATKRAALYAWYARDGGSPMARAISTKLT